MSGRKAKGFDLLVSSFDANSEVVFFAYLTSTFSINVEKFRRHLGTDLPNS
jgi:hypothetical protein